MQSTKPMLSISLLASNRKKTIRNCLESLKPIMEQLPCELIIVDTGCDEEVRNILMEYTQHIIPFTWCHDFSKARNVGLKEAVGEWFLFIDDDEWFADVTEIVDFFKSGEYKKYGQACYIIRNFKDYQERQYTDSWVSRMIRLDKDTQFVGSIHEYLSPMRGACKLLHSSAKHFGYIYNSDEEKYKHSQRNISLLLEILKKEENNSRWWMQLAQEYYGVKEYQKLHDICQDAIVQFVSKSTEIINRERGTFYMGRIMANISRYMYDDAEKDYEKAIADKRNTQFCQAALHAKGSAIYIKKKQYHKAESCCRQYLDIYDKLNELHDKEEELMKQGGFFVRDAFSMEERNNVYSYLIICGLKGMDSSVLKQYFDKMEWMNAILYVSSELVPAIVEYFAEAEYDKYFSEVADVLINRRGVKEKVIKEIQRIEKEGTTQEGFKRLVRIFSQLESENYYIYYLRIFYAWHTDHTLTLNEDLKALFSRVVDIFQLPVIIWNIAEANKIDLEPMFLDISFDQWKKGVDSFMENSDLDSVEFRREIITIQCKQSNARYDYFMMKAAEAQLVYGKSRDSYEKLRELLEEYTERTITYYSRYFKEIAFQGEMELLPLSCRAAVSIGRAMESEAAMDSVKTLQLYKDCIGIFPSLDKTLKTYCQLYKKKEEDKITECREAREEMQDLLNELKKKVIYLAENGMKTDALKTLNQLKVYISEEEFHELEKELFKNGIYRQ